MYIERLRYDELIIIMVSALDSGSSGLGSSPGQGQCVVFLGNTLLLTVPLSTQEYKWVPGNC